MAEVEPGFQARQAELRTDANVMEVDSLAWMDRITHSLVSPWRIPTQKRELKPLWEQLKLVAFCIT